MYASIPCRLHSVIIVGKVFPTKFSPFKVILVHLLCRKLVFVADFCIILCLLPPCLQTFGLSLLVDVPSRSHGLQISAYLHFLIPLARHQLTLQDPHTELVHRAVCLFTPQLAVPTHGRVARLSWPGACLHVEMVYLPTDDQPSPM